jgi:hypothetical protein
MKIINNLFKLDDYDYRKVGSEPKSKAGFIVYLLLIITFSIGITFTYIFRCSLTLSFKTSADIFDVNNINCRPFAPSLYTNIINSWSNNMPFELSMIQFDKFTMNYTNPCSAQQMNVGQVDLVFIINKLEITPQFNLKTYFICDSNCNLDLISSVKFNQTIKINKPAIKYCKISKIDGKSSLYCSITIKDITLNSLINLYNISGTTISYLQITFVPSMSLENCFIDNTTSVEIIQNYFSSLIAPAQIIPDKNIQSIDYVCEFTNCQNLFEMITTLGGLMGFGILFIKLLARNCLQNKINDHKLTI